MQISGVANEDGPHFEAYDRLRPLLSQCQHPLSTRQWGLCFVMRGYSLSLWFSLDYVAYPRVPGIHFVACRVRRGDVEFNRVIDIRSIGSMDGIRAHLPLSMASIKGSSCQLTFDSSNTPRVSFCFPAYSSHSLPVLYRPFFIASSNSHSFYSR